tara:strand:- start:318 stop:491 length:174 start_codon:yes stop_codon:yes gene_type:complete
MNLTDEQKLVIVREGLEFVHFAIQEAQAGNINELDSALEVLELMRETNKEAPIVYII